MDLAWDPPPRLLLEGMSWGNRKEWKVVSCSVMAVVIYLFMYFLLRRRCQLNEQGAQQTLRGGSGSNGALSMHSGFPLLLQGTLNGLKSLKTFPLLAPSFSALHLCLCWRAPQHTPMPLSHPPTMNWDVFLFPLHPYQVLGKLEPEMEPLKGFYSVVNLLPAPDPLISYIQISTIGPPDPLQLVYQDPV